MHRPIFSEIIFRKHLISRQQGNKLVKLKLLFIDQNVSDRIVSGLDYTAVSSCHEMNVQVLQSIKPYDKIALHTEEQNGECMT